MDIISEIKSLISKSVKSLGLEAGNFSVEYPNDKSHGDFSTNVSLMIAKKAGSNPGELAEKIAEILRRDQDKIGISKVEVAGPGFINFFLSNKYFSENLSKILKEGKKYGKGGARKRERVLIEYTDPNPFKQFHIGHLMSNAIGESLSRLIESQGAKVTRLCYQGDVGMHVAKALWGMMRNNSEMPGPKASIQEQINFIGKSYVEGANAFEDNPEAKKEIEEINRKVFDGSDKELNRLYVEGKKVSLKHFDELYKELGTKFDKFIFESSVASDGVKIVNTFAKKGVFEQSDGAFVFKADKYDPKLHTRVFITSQGLPTYEAKELGLNKLKWDKWKPEKSIIITANEQSDYFRVVLKALELVSPEARKVTEHVAHGMLRFAEGKMGSRKGNVITGESLINDVRGLVMEKIKARGFDEKEKQEVSSIVAVSAIKYSILKQAIGGDIIYDFEKSISFEGDSGPYLLYTAVRANSVLEKAKSEGIKAKINSKIDAGEIGKLLSKFPNIVSRAETEKAPQHLATYLVELSGAFNSWYGNTQIVSKTEPESSNRVAITQAVRIVLENGLNLLGIRIPKRM